MTARKKKTPARKRAAAPRTRLAPDERRAQLLRCALSAFAERGIRRTVHADVAKRAECAVSTVFLYFPTRDDLVDAVLGEVERFYIELAEQVHASQAPATEVLLEHGRRYRASIDSHPDHAYVLLNWSANVRSRTWPRYLALVERMTESHRKTIERGITEGTLDPRLDAESAARIIVGYAHMSTQMKLSDMEPERASHFGRQVVYSMLTPVEDAPAA